MSRIVSVERPEEEINYSQWEQTISENFPDLLVPAKIGLSMMSQLLIKDITNAGAVILLGQASSGKTITINFFNAIENFTYSSDSFTPKAFVSGAANVKEEDLEDVDLLPRLRHKLFLVKDFAPIFSKSEEQLREILGNLTRILDGEGFQTDTGVHGRRGYEGDYLFFMLGATTPIHGKVWKVMGNLGPRILFYRMKSPPKTKNELITQLTEQSYKAKEKFCNKTTQYFLETLWNRYPDGIIWERSQDSDTLKGHLVQMADLTARLRAYVEKDEYGDINFGVEYIDRLTQWYYNMARGHAVVQGRYQLAIQDLSIILELAIDSGTTLRAQLFRTLIHHHGIMSTNQIAQTLQKSQTTVLKLMEELTLLGICVEKPTLNDGAGRPEKVIALKDEWQWFASEECLQLLDTPSNLKSLLQNKQTKLGGV